MPDLVQLLARADVRDQALLVLVGVVLALVLLSLAFAAYTLVLRLRSDARERRRAALRARWEEPLLAALADPEAVGALRQRVMPGEELEFVGFLQEYVRRLRGRERDTVRAIARPYLDPVVARAADESREIRTRAVQTLGELGLPDHADTVVAALDDPSPLVAMVAARALAIDGRVEHAPAILARLHRFRRWRTGFMASMLAGMGAEGAPALRSTLADPEQVPWARGVAARALTILSDLEAADVAARVVAREEDPELLTPALHLLAELGRPEHLTVVRPLWDASDASVRAAALRALGTLGGEEDRMRLLGALSDVSPWVAMRAARGLLEGGGELLLQDLTESDHPRASLAAEILEEEA